MRSFSSQTLAIVAGLFFLPVSAFAQQGIGLEGMYVGGYVGGSFFFDQEIDTDVQINNDDFDAETEVDYDAGLRLGGYVGYRISPNVRMQIDASYTLADAANTLDVNGIEVANSDQETTITSGTVGVFLDFWPIANVVPYVGVGVGIAKVDVDLDFEGGVGDNKQTVLTAFGETGLSFDLTPSLAIVPSARISWLNAKTEAEAFDVDVDGDLVEFEIITADQPLYETQLLVQARYSF